MKIIALTDLHMLDVGGTIIGIDPAERLAAALSHIKRHHQDASRLVITGDLAHLGDQASYRRIKDLLAASGLTTTLLLGNHDRRENFRAVFPNATLDAAGFVQAVVEADGWRLVCLDTLNGPPYDHDDIHAGSLCLQRLAWLDKALATAERQPVLLFMHHPPHAVGFRGMDGIRLRNERAFFAILAKHGNVRHIFAGHVHRTISGSVHGIAFSIFKSPVHQQPMTFDSEDTSLSVAEPSAYGIIFAGPDSVLVHTEDYGISGPPA